jgi:hypothetical protein
MPLIGADKGGAVGCPVAPGEGRWSVRRGENSSAGQQRCLAAEAKPCALRLRVVRLSGTNFGAWFFRHHAFPLLLYGLAPTQLATRRIRGWRVSDGRRCCASRLPDSRHRLVPPRPPLVSVHLVVGQLGRLAVIQIVTDRFHRAAQFAGGRPHLCCAAPIVLGLGGVQQDVVHIVEG